MDGVSGYHGWQWIFILEGIATVVVAAASFWMLYDYPDTAKFLTADEKRFMQARLALDNDGCSQAFKYKFVKDAFLDWKVWVVSHRLACQKLSQCSKSSHPTVRRHVPRRTHARLLLLIVRAYLDGQFGIHCSPCPIGKLSCVSVLLSPQTDSLPKMSTPPYVLAAITTVAAGFMSDRLQKRGIVAIIFATIGALGFIMLTVTKIPGVNYTGMFFAAAGVYPLIPVVVSWGSNNCGGSLKKGVATAIIVSVGNAGGVISSFIYPATDKPRYFKGHSINIAYCAFVVFSAAFMSWYLDNQNKKKDARNAARDHAWTDAEKVEHEDRGDDVDWFRYTI